jgi:hypothetical protein
MMNWNGIATKWLSATDMCLEGLCKTTNDLRIYGIQAEIRTKSFVAPDHSVRYTHVGSYLISFFKFINLLIALSCIQMR